MHHVVYIQGDFPVSIEADSPQQAILEALLEAEDGATVLKIGVPEWGSLPIQVLGLCDRCAVILLEGENIDGLLELICSPCFRGTFSP